MKNSFRIQQVPYQDVLPLRARILKPHLPLAECENPGDLRSDTFHLAAFDLDQIIGIASFEFENHPDFFAKKSARLRGMATDENYRRSGIGKLLVMNGTDVLRALNTELLWFNAREKAFPFYESLGFQFHGEFFELPKIGPHKVMYKYLK